MMSTQFWCYITGVILLPTSVSGLMGAFDTMVSEVGKMCNNDTVLLYLFINKYIYLFSLRLDLIFSSIQPY